MASLPRIAPIFGVRDLDAALEHYHRLGFAVRTYAGGGDCGYATRDGVEIHLGVAAPGKGGGCSAYLFVGDADHLGADWRSAGVEVHMPEETAWGKREGAIVDPDGNVIRFGSPLTGTA